MSDIVEQMECLNAEERCFFHNDTQTFYTPDMSLLSIAEEYEDGDDLSRYPEWQREGILDAVAFLEHEEEYIALPNQFDINEYEIMEKFCEQINSSGISNELLRAISGRGAFRRFKDAIINYNIERDWYAFREAAYIKMAIEWCEENNISYEM